MRFLLCALLLFIGVQASIRQLSAKRDTARVMNRVQALARYNNYEHYSAGSVDIAVPDFANGPDDKLTPKNRPVNTANYSVAGPWAAEKDNAQRAKVFTVPMLVCSGGDYWSAYSAAERICKPEVNTIDRLKKLHSTDAPIVDGSINNFQSVFENYMWKSVPVGIDAIWEKIERHHGLFGKFKASHNILYTGTTGKRWTGSKDNFGSQFYRNDKGMSGGDVLKHTLRKVQDKETADVHALSYNDDHFSWCARSAYRTGHAVAQETAFNAGKKYAKLLAEARRSNPNANIDAKLQQEVESEFKKSLAQDGYAMHFLSDLFSAGHIRTPRFEARGFCADKVGGVAGLTCNVMHDEDNFNGLFVTNGQNKKWMTWGDFFYFDAANGLSRKYHKNAIVVSLTEVVNAFWEGVHKRFDNAPKADAWPADALKHIPQLAGLLPYERQLIPCPLYHFENNKWYIRKSRGEKGVAFTKFAQERSDAINAVRNAAKINFEDDSVADLNKAEKELAQALKRVKSAYYDWQEKNPNSNGDKCEYEEFSKDAHCCHQFLKGRAVPFASATGIVNAFSNKCKDSSIKPGKGSFFFYPAP